MVSLDHNVFCKHIQNEVVVVREINCSHLKYSFVENYDWTT